MHNFVKGILYGALIKPEEVKAERVMPGGLQADAADSLTQG
jgi:hypothetical protein